MPDMKEKFSDIPPGCKLRFR